MLFINSDAGKVVSQVPANMQESGSVAQRLFVASDNPVSAEVATMRELPDSMSA
jgi:hypothetical protein